MSDLYIKEVQDFDSYRKAKDMLLSGRKPAEVAKELGVTIKELTNWFLKKKPAKN